jgi:hypothetical protein
LAPCFSSSRPPLFPFYFVFTLLFVQEWLGDEDPESDLSDVDEEEEDGDDDDDDDDDEDEEGGGAGRRRGGDSDEDESTDSDNEPVTKEERDLFSMSLRDRQKRVKVRVRVHRGVHPLGRSSAYGRPGRSCSAPPASPGPAAVVGVARHARAARPSLHTCCG